MSHRFAACLTLFSCCSFLFGACIAETFFTGSDGGSDGFGPSFGKCLPGQDDDQDGIPNEVEGCTADTDKDGIPNYADTDSDNDGIPDAIEAGPRDKDGNCAWPWAGPSWPCDSDGDGVPDYLDTDSDNDGVDDGNEDLNGDGLLGCCLDRCGEQRKGCPPPETNGCGAGQECIGDTCQPAASFFCASGETDPRNPHTFPDYPPDNQLPSFVCHDRSEDTAKGLKPLQFKQSNEGNWNVALEVDALYGEALISQPRFKEAAANFDLVGQQQAVAGFIISLPTMDTDVSETASVLGTVISTQLPNKVSVQQLVSGTASSSHDGYPTVLGTQLELVLAQNANPPTVRNDLLPILMGRAPAELSNMPATNWGPGSKRMILSFQTLLRHDGRLIIMGAVADKAMVQDASKHTSFHLDDLANGTGLATSSDSDTVECDPFVLDRLPIADIIWVVDESGSMDDNREDIVNNAKDFFSRALQAGLDFRMGVTGVKQPLSSVQLGKFCSRASSSASDDGGVDRFLRSDEQSTFEACIENPPYYEGGSEYGLANAFEAVTSHLPRAAGAANDLSKIRQEATLVLIIATDEAPEELKSSGKYNGKSGFLNSADYNIDNCSTTKLSQIQSYVQDWITLFQGQSASWGTEAKAIVHLIAGVCKSKCGSSFMQVEYPWGYQEIVKATGGQIADICQQNLGTTLQLIIDSIIGAASPVVLELIPISASLAVAINQTQLVRSRQQGFDYSSSSNSIIFINQAFNKGDLVVVSYRRWFKQAPIE